MKRLQPTALSARFADVVLILHFNSPCAAAAAATTATAKAKARPDRPLVSRSCSISHLILGSWVTLGYAQVWEEAASRHVSLQAQTQPLKAFKRALAVDGYRQCLVFYIYIYMCIHTYIYMFHDTTCNIQYSVLQYRNR